MEAPASGLPSSRTTPSTGVVFALPQPTAKNSTSSQVTQITRRLCFSITSAATASRIDRRKNQLRRGPFFNQILRRARGHSVVTAAEILISAVIDVLRH